MKKVGIVVAAAMAIMVGCGEKKESKIMDKTNTMEQSGATAGLVITQEWDKTFPLSNKVKHEKIAFPTNYGFTLVADLYIPKEGEGKKAAIAVSGPYGAVKEQVSGRYAMVMAERGYVTLAFDPSFTGESSGEPRYTSSPDINTEDFLAAVDYLTTREDVDAERIGICGICGWGGIAINAAAIDTRIKATLAVTMYDMTRVYCNGYNDAEDNEESRYQKRDAASKQRTIEAKTKEHARTGGNPKEASEEMPQFVKDYIAYYSTERGYHERSLGSNGGWNQIGQQAYLNTRFLHFSNEIRSAVLLVHGAEAHSRYFSETAYKDMVKGNPCPENKELYIVEGAVHCDLYDGAKPHSAGNDSIIPWEKIAQFYDKYLGK